MEENLFNRLVYLDHNVLDMMSKGKLKGIEELFTDTKYIAVYSTENLNEIKRSTGYENSFLEVLNRIKARHIIPNVDENYHYIGTAKVLELDPKEVYISYLENIDETPDLGYGLTGIARKMYGGLSDMTFREIFENGTKEIETLLDIPEEYIDKLDIEFSQKEDIKTLIKQLPDMLRDSHLESSSKMDNELDDNAVKQLESAIGVGPKELKNISSPNVLMKIWNEIKDTFPQEQITIEKFFGLDQSDWSTTPDRELTIIEKVNAIYHQLNFIGYFRDSKMKKNKRFIASFSDMTHAGIATFCKSFICRDESLVMKAAASYEYLGLKTKIIHLKN